MKKDQNQKADKEFDLSAVRFKLQHLAPYLGAALWALRPVKKEGIGTFGVDANWRMYYDDKVPWTLDECVGVLVHEINHLLRAHHDRGQAAPPGNWNIAADMEINDDLDAWTLPPDGIHPHKFGLPNGKLAEEYYQLLDTMAKQQGKQDLTDGQGVPWDCGSAAGSEPSDYEDPLDGGDESSSDGITDIEKEAIKKQVAQAISENKNRGTVPAGLARWAEEYLNPTIPWTKLLRGYVKRALQIVSGGATDYTFSKPSRRDDPDFIFPKPVTRKPTVSVLIDTSGSIGGKEYEEFMAEVMGLVKSHASDITIAMCDAAVHSIETVSTRSQVKKLKAKGGGGTDMRVGIRALLDHHPTPNILIVLTDGYTPWPDHAPAGVQSIIVLSANSRGVETPTWAKTLTINS